MDKAASRAPNPVSLNSHAPCGSPSSVPKGRQRSRALAGGLDRGLPQSDRTRGNQAYDRACRWRLFWDAGGTVKSPRGGLTPSPLCLSEPSAGKDNAILLGDGMDRRSLAHEILSQLPLAQQTAAWGTLGTIKPYLGFDAEGDVQRLIEAIAGNGADHGAILDVLTNRTSAQRQQITKVFQDLTKQDLLKSMEAALSGNLERVIVGLLKPPAQYDAHELRAAMQVWPGDAAPPWEAGGVHVANQPCARLSQCGWYTQCVPAPGALCWYRVPVPGHPPPPGQPLVGRPGLTLPFPTLAVFGQYRKSRGLEVEETISKRFRGDGQMAMLALAAGISPSPSMSVHLPSPPPPPQDPGTDDKVLIRVLISRSETDLLSIRSEFKKHHGQSLYSCLQTRGDYQAALLALCRAEDL
uniref:Annexin A9 n=1 Tax=Chelydra serpentina TaxID=8475 RepID=A0A8C3SE34_CHESE